MVKSQGKVGKKSKSLSRYQNDDDDDLEDDNRIRNHTNRAGASIDDDGDVNRYAVTKDNDESIDDSGSDVGWDSSDEVNFFGNSKKSSKRSLLEEEEEDVSDDEDELGDGEILLSDMMNQHLQNSEDEEDDDEEDENNEEQEDENHARLLDSIGNVSQSLRKESSKRPTKSSLASQRIKESSFSSLLGSSSVPGGQVTIDDLLGSTDDGVRVNKIARQRLSELLQSPHGQVPVFTERVVSDRLERQQNYEKEKKDMTKWQELVVKNRHVSTLDLADDHREMPSFKSLVQKFRPTTSLEKDIEMVLLQHDGNTDQAAELHEMDELGHRQISAEELKTRQRELAQVKALLFYQQMKSHRLNKIKSKTYRSIRKKAKQRLLTKNNNNNEDGDGGDDVQQQNDNDDDKESLRRVQERMDLRHSSRSKWSRMAREHGQHDSSLKKAYHDSVQLGRDLIQKIDRMHNEDEDDNEDVLESLKKVIQQDEEEEGPQIHFEGKFQKLFDMDFMRRAAEQQRQKAKRDAIEVLREIQEMQRDDDDEEGEDDEKITTEVISKENRKEMDNLFRSSKGLVISRKRKVVLGDVDVDLPPNSIIIDEQQEQEQLPINPWITSGQQSKRVKRKDQHHLLLLDLGDKQREGGGSVPSSSYKKISSSSSSNNNNNNNISSNSNNNTSNNNISNNNISNNNISNNISNKMDNNRRAPLLSQKSQVDLVKMAFAGPDLEQEFLDMKRREVDDELGLDDKKAIVLNQVKAGWGDWTGPGEKGVSQKILSQRDRLMSKIQTEGEVKRMNRHDEKLMNVMISERRIKVASKFKISEVPHPFSTREEYERSMKMPIGSDWNASTAVKNRTQPEIKLRAGRIINPLKLPKKKN